jgi:hypothetical protein
VLFLHNSCTMRLVSLALASLIACAAPADEEVLDDNDDGKSDGQTSSRFIEVDPTHTNKTFRAYIHGALDAMSVRDVEVSQLTVTSIAEGHVRIDELSDLTCGDFLRVLKDLPDLGLTPQDHARLKERASPVTAAISAALDGYMWSNRIYVSRGQSAKHLAATLIHEVNHVLNHSEVGYYDDLPTSAFLHEFRAFHVEREFDPAAYEGIDLIDFVIMLYDLDRERIPDSVLADPLTPRILPTTAAWLERYVGGDVEPPADCM